MKARFFISTMGLAAASLCAQRLPVENLPIGHEGMYWVRTTGEVTVPSTQPRVQITTNGKITVHGGDGDQITWKMRQLVSPGSALTEEGARRRLGEITPHADIVGNLTVLTIDTTAQRGVSNYLEIMVPKRLQAVILQTQSGGILAYDLDGDVRAVAGSGDLQIDRIGGNVLQAQTGGGNIHLGRIAGAVQQCSTGAGDVIVDSLGRTGTCTTAGGDMLVQEAAGPLNLSTEGGNIRVVKAAGAVNGFSGAGLIEIGQAGGPVVADARGGSIRVASARGVRAASAAGMVNVRASSGPMSVSTVMGSIMAELLAGGRLEDSSLVAGTGDITVWIPSNLAVTVMATNESGTTRRVFSDFPEIHINSNALFRAPLMAQGALNGGGPVLRINASGGVIYLRRTR